MRVGLRFDKRAGRDALTPARPHSHSIVPGGFEVMS
jgi:hypothetical protein